MQKWASDIINNEASVDSIIEALKEKLGEDKLKKALCDLIKGESIYLTISGNYLDKEEKAARKNKEAYELREMSKNMFKKKPEWDYNKEWLQYTFVENEIFQPVKELVDKTFTMFFEKLVFLSQHQQELKEKKQELLKIFYYLIYQRISQDEFLMQALQFIKEANIKIEKGDNLLIQKVILDAALEHFIEVIDIIFTIPTLVLTAFEASAANYEKELCKANKKLSGSKKLKPEDEAYKAYINFVDEMLEQNLTKYKVIKNYLNNHKNINQSEKSLGNAFDSFLKNHKDEIKKRHNLSDDTFNIKFFPAKLSKK